MYIYISYNCQKICLFMIRLKKLHHSAYRCQDSEETRKFYEDFLELQLIKVLEITITKTDRKTNVLHTFYTLRDGSCIAFFEDPETKFNFKKQRDFDLHIAFEVGLKDLNKMYKKGLENNIETRGIINHGFIKSVYFRDPNGYVIELSYPQEKLGNEKYEDNLKKLSDWQKNKIKNFSI